MILSALAAAKGPENHEDEKSLPLIHLVRNIYINSNLNPLAKFTSSSRSTEFKDTLSCNISQMIMKTISISIRIVISYAMKQASCFEFIGKLWKLRQQHDQNFPLEGKTL